MELTEIRNVLVLGGGTLGLRIGLAAAINGYNVTIYDINESSFDAARKLQDIILHLLVKENRLAQNRIEGGIAN
ncbi:MAG: 3-hydroxyacyl-CoA dehydrogenase NAD-binding domain-containing protein [Cyclobacteriaceae bacterium]|nr:3-hydroxyacyl-CoA dehydrogenase NAD-binding domain-containing protein [Cyclobacteriaceae bacterium]